MHNTYFSSTIYAVRSKCSVSLSFNDYSNFSYERFDRTPSCLSSCCNCCDCCALPVHRVPINPSLLFGPRQSTLLHLSTSRRLILGARDRYFSQLAAYGRNGDYYQRNCSFNERSVRNRSRRRLNERGFYTVSGEESETNRSFGSDDTESVLSLLSEEADENFTGLRENNVSSFKRVEAEKERKNGSRERNMSSGKKGEVKKGNLKHRGTLTIELKKEDEKINKERKAFTKGEDHGKRRDVSSCSSYYSLSSSGDFGSDLEVQDKHGKLFEEFSVEEDKASHKEGQVKEEFNRQRNNSEKLEEISNQQRAKFGADIDWNLRKKSEKKLTEVTMEETESSKGHQDMHPRVFRTDQSSDGRASTSQKQFESDDDNSSFIRNFNKKTREDNIQTENRRKYQSTEIQESGGNDVEETFSGREGNLEISKTLLQEMSDEHQNIVGSYTGKDAVSRNYQKYTGKSKIQDSASISNTRMKILREKETSGLSSAGKMEEQHYQKGDKIIMQNEGRRKSQLSELSQVLESDAQNASIVKSSKTMKNWEENPNLSSDVKGTRNRTDVRMPQRIQPRKGSELVSTISEGNASGQKQVSSSHKTSNEVRFIQKTNLTSVVNTRENYCQTDERITQFNPSSEAERPNYLAISDEIVPKEAPSFQEPLIYEARKQYVILAEGGEPSSETTLMPSSSQVMERGSSVVKTTATSIPEVGLDTSESSSSAMYNNLGGRTPALQSELCSRDGSGQTYTMSSNIRGPEDSLGSADRLEKSSEQFVDTFVEKVRHEVTTSKTQEMKITGTKFSTEDEKNQTYIARQQGTQNGSKIKEGESSRSYGFSGTKGPSDEMWDVPEPSVKQSPPAEEEEVSLATGNTIVKRTGKNLWSIIADIVRLRWGSRADASTSAARSGERSSSNKSDSETWFSGQEHEETSKSKVRKEGKSLQSQATSSDQPQPAKSDTQSEGEVSYTTKLTDKGEHLEVGMSSSPNEMESGSTSIGISFASGEENVNWTEDGKDLQVSTSGVETMELSTPLPARPPVVEEIVLGRNESLGLMEEPVAPMQMELSGTRKKEAELKQRKLKRNKQVIKDRFDEWEEAYKLELEQRRMDEMYMREALLEAKKAGDTWEVPVGAVLVQDGKIIARGFNLVEELRDSTAHAEMICIREASNLLRTWRLAGTTLYVTLEPCPMCAGAILQARIDTLVWGAPNKLLGADGSWVRLFSDGGENASEPKDKPPAPVHPFHPNMKIRRGVLASECADVMQQFFQLRRKKKKESPPPPEPSQSSSLPTTHHHPSKFLSKMHDVFHMMFYAFLVKLCDGFDCELSGLRFLGSRDARDLKPMKKKNPSCWQSVEVTVDQRSMEGEYH
ncbi:tRNA(adenine(34)) deaminase, chloroplastic [Senna tora]|uniref:tRNA(adenine(34)) deaminase n=1 Tax=Senna tora TaxID=362788 RepID=A0A834TX04_9FABA|nr:tRNA(adenine(34)) deaminase, chloroplastic [Senna tora]